MNNHTETPMIPVPGEMAPLAESFDPRVEQVPQPPESCLLYTSPSPRDGLLSRMPSSA